MIIPFLIFTMLSASAAATPMHGGPLKEIEQVPGSSNGCGAVVVHANAAIAATLHDDQIITRTIARMRSANLEGGTLLRRQGMSELERLAASLHDTQTQGIGEVERLRDLVANAGDATEKRELHSFTEALADALNRQAKIGADLSGLLTSLDVQELRNQSSAGTTDDSSSAGNQTDSTGQHFGTQTQNTSPNAMLYSTAADFQARVPGIQNDEVKAAEHSEGAVSGC